MQIDSNDRCDQNCDLVAQFQMPISNIRTQPDDQNQTLEQSCRNFLQQPAAQRWEIMQRLGLARYDFLTKMPLSNGNIAAIMRFLARPQQVKFPQLQNTQLSGLDLNQTNLIRANLTAAQLVNTSLVDADLIFANFTAANLTGANLTGATLNQTIWQDAVVTDCRLGSGIGLSSKLKFDLQTRGAVLAF